MNRIEKMLKNNFKMFLSGKIDENIFEQNLVFLNKIKGDEGKRIHY